MRFEMIDKIFCVLLLAILTTAEIPPYIQVCGRKNPNLDECIRNSIDKIKYKFVEGIPELDVPSINPLIVKNVKLADLPNFKASADNVKIYGLEKFTIDKSHLDLDKKQIEVTLKFDKLKIEADYDVDAKILIPVVGHGPIELETDNVSGKATMRYKIIQRKGKNYVYFYTVTMKVEISDYKANFLPNGDIDGTLTTAINAALVDGKQELIDSTIPNVETKISEYILDISNKICKHFTYEELFPDKE